VSHCFRKRKKEKKQYMMLHRKVAGVCEEESPHISSHFLPQFILSERNFIFQHIFPTKLQSSATKHRNSSSSSSSSSSTIISKLSSTFQHFQLNLKATQPKTTILVLILLSSTILSKRNFIFQHISS
jgi:hypothetical protein